MKTASLVDGAWRLDVTDTHEAVTQITAFAQQHDVRILEITSAVASLEDAFMTILEQNTDASQVKR